MKDLFSNFNIFRFIRLCIKSWPVFLATVLTCLIFFGLISMIKKQKSEVMAQLMLKEESAGSSLMMAGQIARSFSLGDMFGGSTSADNEAHVLQSHTVFLSTVKQLGLNTFYKEKKMPFMWVDRPVDTPISLTTEESIPDTLSVVITFNISPTGDGKYDIKAKAAKKTIVDEKSQTLPVALDTPYGPFTLNATEYLNPEKPREVEIMFCSYDVAACIYENMINIYVPDRKIDFINISYVTDYPAFGKTLISHIIDNYIDLSNDYKLQRSNQSLKLVDDRLETLSQELLSSENAIENFKTQNKLTDPDVDAQFLMSKSGNLEVSLLEAQTNYEVVKMTRDFISNPQNNNSLIPELILTSNAGKNADTNISLIAQYNQLILERMQLTATAKDTNSSVQQLDKQIDALRANIITSVNRVYENAKLALNDLKSEATKNNSRIGQLPSIERQYLVLKRDNMLQEQIYLFLLQQKEELNMSLASRSLPAQIIDQPYQLAEGIGMSRKMLLAIGLFLGLCLGAAYVLLFKMNKAPIKSADEINDMLDLPKMHCATIKADGAKLDIDSEGANAESLRQLRSDIQFALDGCNGKAVAVTSVNQQECKSFIAANLAASLAMTGKKTLIIDLDLRNPSISDILGVDTSAMGIAGCINGTAPTIQSVNVGDYTLDVISAGKTKANPADIVANEMFANTLTSYREMYDYIIIDSSSIKGYSEIYALTGQVDMTLAVCKTGVINPTDIAVLNELFNEGRLKRLATVVVS